MRPEVKATSYGLVTVPLLFAFVPRTEYGLVSTGDVSLVIN